MNETGFKVEFMFKGWKHKEIRLNEKKKEDVSRGERER